MNININGFECELKFSFRALMIYEDIMGKSFEPKNTKDFVVFFYCAVLAARKDLPLDLEGFIDWLDNNPDKFSEFVNWLTGQFTRENGLSGKDDGVDEEPKKA